MPTILICFWSVAARAKPVPAEAAGSIAARLRKFRRSTVPPFWKPIPLSGNGVLLDVGIDARVAIGPRRSGRDVVEGLGILDAVLPAQGAGVVQAELLDEVPIGSEVVVAEHRQLLVALRQLGAQPRSGMAA